MKKRKNILPKLLIYAFIFTILFPLALTAVWAFVGRWPWPRLLPQSFSLRGIEEIFGGYSGAFQTLGSSILLSAVVAILAVIVGTMTARALVLYDFPGKSLIQFSTILPIIIPSTVFAMGTHVLFIKVGLADNVLGVIIVHLICSLPYTVKIMTDVTAAFGGKLEEQAAVLGATSRQIMKEVTLPALMPGLVSSACMAYIISFGQYFVTLIIGGGNVKTFTLIMVPYLQSGDRVIASAYSIVFILSTLLVFIIFELAVRRFKTDENNYYFV